MSNKSGMHQWSLGEVLNCTASHEPFLWTNVRPTRGSCLERLVLQGEQYDKHGIVMCLLAILLTVQL